jgi:drug/metabolite transporter (DMT)-like permease
MLIIVSLYALVASTFTFSKAILSFVQPVIFTGVRMLVSGLILLAYQYFFNHSQWRFSLKDWFWFLQIMIFMVYIVYVGEFVAMSHGVTSGKSSLFFNLAPFFTALLGYALSLETMNKRKWLGLLIGLVGIVPILLAAPTTVENTFSWWRISFGELLLLGAVFSSAYGWLIMKRLVYTDTYSPVMVNGIAMIGGGIMALVNSFFVEKAPYFTLTVPANDTIGQWFLTWMSDYSASIVLFILYSVLLILITNVIFYNAYGFLLRRYSATFLSLVGITTPLFTVVWSWFLLGEKVGWSFGLSMIITSIGLFIFYQEELRRGQEGN